MSKQDDPAEILRIHNKWRRGADIPMLDPAEVGRAIDAVLLRLAILEKDKRVMDAKHG